MHTVNTYKIFYCIVQFWSSIKTSNPPNFLFHHYHATPNQQTCFYLLVTLLKHSILEELSLFIIDKQRVRLVCKSINFSLLPKILSGRKDGGGGGGASRCFRSPQVHDRPLTSPFCEVSVSATPSLCVSSGTLDDSLHSKVVGAL
jgi:hypothetical protein